MKIEILGSGGAVVVPRPGFHDKLNDEARAKGVPYQRRGPAVFMHGPDILFDTPEDIVESLNRANIDRVQHCFYSHYHPDHVMGRRVFEQVNWDLRGSVNKLSHVYVPERVRDDMKKLLGSWSHLEYLQSIGVVELHVITPGEAVQINDYTITPLPLAEEYVFAYLVEQDDKRVWIAMDELFGWSPDESVTNLDLAILPSGVCEFHPLTGERRVEADQPVLRTEMRFERTLECIRDMSPRQAVLIHLDEPDGISYDDGLVLSEKLQSEGLPVTFGWDGLVVKV
ncbi:MAG: MBL fold metallo-hydrolase [Thermomicrobiales bacterium]|nr:MBL fold metallo-hydrolase [Thermomicrobiales bacterium]